MIILEELLRVPNKVKRRDGREFSAGFTTGKVAYVNDDDTQVKVDSGNPYYTIPGEENRHYDSNRIVRSGWIPVTELEKV
jgi:hypothetical protein